MNGFALKILPEKCGGAPLRWALVILQSLFVKLGRKIRSLNRADLKPGFDLPVRR
jgi:hypothetical protein